MPFEKLGFVPILFSDPYVQPRHNLSVVMIGFSLVPLAFFVEMLINERTDHTFIIVKQ